MAKTDTEIKYSIEHAIKAFSVGTLTQNSLNLFHVLGYNTDRQQPLPDKTFACFKEYYLDYDCSFNEEKALIKEWQQIDLLFQLTKEEVTGQNSLFDTAQVDRTIMEAYLFFCIELNDKEYTRTALSQITREINKVFKMPVMVLFKLGEKLSLAVINRRLHKKYDSDVLGKVTLIKDINILKPHRAHREILFDLSIEKLLRVHKFTNFIELHEAWKKTLDTKVLNKRFYKELSDWYFWAIKEVYFPGAPFQATLGANAITDHEVREHNAKNLIRLLTRLLFVWFIKEKNLVPDQLFDERFIKEKLLTGFDPAKTGSFDDHAKASRYYRAILQNLFFASLNQVVGKREFRKQGQHMNVTNLMRYESYFKEPQAFVALIDNVVPFMNGGLFECLDKPDPQKKGKQGGDVIIYEDGFSDRADNTLCVPDYIFFSNSEHADLSSELDDKKQSNVTVRGLINILNDYKFTVTENTPIEEDIALDPELLGRVFENLLASYNPETKTTARKQTGSFYTPREIVDYMVDESLKAYLKQKLVAVSGMKAEDADVGLNILFSYTEKEHAFNNDEKHVLIEAIDACKVLDPACGSGAFPMGILHKLVLILHKLDPDNVLWREQQRQNAIKETENAFRIGNQEERDNRLKDISDVFENNAGDFGRKLYLIESCIYGVDIQPIATQISKLRFFISLIVDQQSNTDKAHNYGVIPLPNLETKFVAANTLVGLKKPERQINFFDNQEIRKIELQIQQVRHKLFSAKKPSKKRELRAEDQRLRDQMGLQLLTIGYENDIARQLATWDPYDQNAWSPFFDMEWMFGIEDGFDVVIGNPPYGAKFNQAEKNYFKEYYCHQNYQPESFLLFVEKAFQMMNHFGGMAFIIPNTWLSNLRLVNIRKLIFEKSSLVSISHYHHAVFEAVVDTEVLVLKNGYNACNLFDVNVVTSEKKSTIQQSQDYFKAKNGLPVNIFSSKEELKIIGIIDRYDRLDSFCDLFSGYVPYEVGKGMPPQTKEMLKNRIYDSEIKIDQSYKPVLRGSDFHRFEIKWKGDRWIKYGKNLAAPRNSVIFSQNKIVLRQTGDELIGVLDENNFVCPKNTHIILPKKGTDLKYILGILNSKVATFYFRFLNPEAGEALAEVKKETISKIPIPKNTNSSTMTIIVDIIQYRYKSSVFDDIYNALAFNYYFSDHMKEREIDVIDYVQKDIENSLQGQEFKILADVEKEKVIEQLQATWSHPDNKVRNRIKLFAVRSPEILKPIIES